MFIIGRYYFKRYFDGKIKEQLLLLFVCLFFTFLPDIFLIIWYATRILPICIFYLYHDFTQLILLPVSIVALLILIFLVDIRRKPIWIMGFLSILLHIVMDLFISDSSVFI
jgi:hypothetical protein